MKKHAKFQWNSRKSPAENARAVLPTLARDYFDLGQKAAELKVSASRLHAFRLASKRFRYTLEMFESVYGPGLGARLKQVHRIQQVLGEIQDCVAVSAMDLCRKNPRLLAWLNRRAREKRAEFRKLWNKEFALPIVQRRWIAYLIRYAK